jgi:Fe-S-cluster containining protein
MNCERCGTCCEKGGPALHREDRHLVDAGLIAANCLFTIRRGELARDNVKEALVPMAEEVIKIKGQDGRWTCLFYDRDHRQCGIYAHRPLECRALNCRDTSQIETVYATGRLTREDLLAQMEGLWDLIVDHEARCGYDRLRDLVAKGTVGKQLKMEAEILEILRYDAHLRTLTVETGGMDAGMLDFIFGRPLAETIGMFDLRLVKEQHRYRLEPTAKFF